MGRVNAIITLRKVKNMNKIKVIIYCRVSSKEQEETGYSLDAQEKLLKEYADQKNFDVVKIYRISESASGKQIRKTFNEMLQFAVKSKISIILCEKIDRLTRNLKDAASISDWINENEIREVHFVKENFIVNKNTRAHENLVWDMKVAIARFYTNNLSEEVKKGQKEKIAQGGYPQKAPIGYKTTGEKGHKIHVIDEVMGPLARRMFELFATGNYSIKALVEVIHKEGLRNLYGNKISKSRMHEYLSNPFYYGKFMWNDELHKGDHKPLISKDLFDSVQLKLNRKGGEAPKYQKHLPVFKAKIKCDQCGSIITWYIKKGHWYGAHNTANKDCPNRKNGCLRQEKAEEQLFPYFDGVAPKSERVLKWLEDALKESHADEINYNTKKRDEFNRVIRNADRRMEQAYRDKLDGKVPSLLCEKIIADAIQEKEIMMESLENLSEGRTQYYQAGYAIHELASKAKEIYSHEKTSPDDKRLLLSLIFSNLSLNTNKITPNYTFGFEFLTKWVPTLNNNFEPADLHTKSSKNEAFDPVFDGLLPG